MKKNIPVGIRYCATFRWDQDPPEPQLAAFLEAVKIDTLAYPDVHWVETLVFFTEFISNAREKRSVLAKG
jgi:hypothetical protein